MKAQFQKYGFRNYRPIGQNYQYLHHVPVKNATFIFVIILANMDPFLADRT